MSDNKPNGPLDRIAQELADVKRYMRQLEQRIVQGEQFNLKILQTLKRGEETFDLRVARAQFNVFHQLTHSLEHSIEAYQTELAAAYRGFNIEVVNGQNVVENEESIIIRKTGEDTYDFSKAITPDIVQNEGTEIFVKHLNENPQLFGDRTEILVNLTTHIPLDQMVKEVPADGN